MAAVTSTKTRKEKKQQQNSITSKSPQRNRWKFCKFNANIYRYWNVCSAFWGEPNDTITCDWCTIHHTHTHTHIHNSTSNIHRTQVRKYGPYDDTFNFSLMYNTLHTIVWFDIQIQFGNLLGIPCPSFTLYIHVNSRRFCYIYSVHSISILKRFEPEYLFHHPLEQQQTQQKLWNKKELPAVILGKYIDNIFSLTHIPKFTQYCSIIKVKSALCLKIQTRFCTFSASIGHIYYGAYISIKIWYPNGSVVLHFYLFFSLSLSFSLCHICVKVTPVRSFRIGIIRLFLFVFCMSFVLFIVHLPFSIHKLESWENQHQKIVQSNNDKKQHDKNQ